MNVELVKEYYIEAAHCAPDCGINGARQHGHSFRIEIVVAGPVESPYGWLIDYGDITAAFDPLRTQLDHADLNKIPGLDNPSFDGLAAWIDKALRPALPMLKEVRVSTSGDDGFAPQELDEDPSRNLPRRLRFSFEAAQSLPQLPEGHPCRGLHGHTYHVEAGAMDLMRLWGHLRGLYEALDHRYLNEIAGIGAATSEQLCAWIWEFLSRSIDDLNVVVVQETQTARCIYRGK
jgi:6-pyruvoyltetrahydropterin/6-carboxytetrahydropterin synthase